jgi:hypothetical protein
MNTRLVTTGLVPLIIGSQETFQLKPLLNGLPWDLTGGTVTLILLDPTGAQTTISGTIAGRGATAPWTVTGPVGNWTRCWHVSDGSGLVQYSQPLVFTVSSSP